MSVVESAMTESSGLRRWLSFDLADESYAIDLARIHEVVRLTEMAHVPGAAAEMLGLVSLRGAILGVLDGRHRLHLDPHVEWDDALRRLVVLSTETGEQVALLVDAVHDVIEQAVTDLLPPPARQGLGINEVVQAVLVVDEAFIAILDVDRLCRLRLDND